MATLKKLGITAIVNMRMRTIHPENKLVEFNYLHLPTPDREAPVISDLTKGVQFIKEEIDRGGKVYIHCRSGEGRGPTMVMAYLISEGMTLDDAFTLVKSVRPFIRPTKVQKNQLRTYENKSHL